MKKTYCRFCLSYCGLLINYDKQKKMFRVTGDTDDIISKGYTCKKGRSIYEYYFNNNRRIDKPILNSKPTSWNIAIKELSNIIKQNLDKFGPDSIALYNATGNITDSLGSWEALGFMKQIKSNMIFTTSTVDAVSKTFIANEFTNGVYPGLIPQIDYENTECLIMFGTNPKISHGHLFGNKPPEKKIKDIKKKKIKFILSDPRTTDISKISDLHLKMTPDSDWVLLSYCVKILINSVLKNNKKNFRNYIEEIKKIKLLVRHIDINFVIKNTGISKKEINKFNKIILNSEKISIITGTGITFADSAIISEWMIWLIAFFKNSLDKKGGIIFNPGFPNYIYENKSNIKIKPNSNYWLFDKKNFLFPFRENEQPCTNLVNLIESKKVKVLICVGGSLITALPDANKTIKALKIIPNYIEMNTHFTENSNYAKLILPVAGPLERTDSTLYTQNSLEYFGGKFTEAIFNYYKKSKPVWWIFRKILSQILDDQNKNLKISELKLLENIKNGRDFIKNKKLIKNSVFIEGKFPTNWIKKNLYKKKWSIYSKKLNTEFLRIKNKSIHTRYKYKLIAFRESNKLNTMNMTKNPDVFLAYINQKEMKLLKINNDDKIIIYNSNGQISAKAKLDDTLLKKTIAISHGYFKKNNVSNLTSNQYNVNTLTGMPNQTALEVNIKKV